MPDSVSAIRIKDRDGRVELLDVAVTEPGCIVGVALLADSSPASLHDHHHGQRLVTASLSVQMGGALPGDPPARARIEQRLGEWPFVAGGALIVGRSGTAIASSHTTSWVSTPRRSRRVRVRSAPMAVVRCHDWTTSRAPSSRRPSPVRWAARQAVSGLA